MHAAAGTAVVGTLAVALLAGPLWRMSERAATDLLEPEAYIAEVLG